MLSLVSSNLGKAKEKQKRFYDQRHRDDKFQVGDKIVVKDTTLSSKEKGITAGLCPLYKPGVAEIHKVVSDLDYEIIFADGTIRGPVHIQSLRRYFARGDTTTPKINMSSQQSQSTSSLSTASSSTSPNNNTNNSQDDIMNDNYVHAVNDNISSDNANIHASNSQVISISNNSNDNSNLNSSNFNDSSQSIPISNSNPINYDQPVAPATAFDMNSEPSAPNVDFSLNNDGSMTSNFDATDPSQPPRRSHRLQQKDRLDYKKFSGSRQRQK
jgi:hypothetical protein